MIAVMVVITIGFDGRVSALCTMDTALISIPILRHAIAIRILAELVAVASIVLVLLFLCHLAHSMLLTNRYRPREKSPTRGARLTLMRVANKEITGGCMNLGRRVTVRTNGSGM